MNPVMALLSKFSRKAIAPAAASVGASTGEGVASAVLGAALPGGMLLQVPSRAVSPAYKAVPFLGGLLAARGDKVAARTAARHYARMILQGHGDKGVPIGKALATAVKGESSEALGQQVLGQRRDVIRRYLARVKHSPKVAEPAAMQEIEAMKGALSVPGTGGKGHGFLAAWRPWGSVSKLGQKAYSNRLDVKATRAAKGLSKELLRRLKGLPQETA